MFCLTNCLTTCRHSQRLSPTVGESIARGSGASARAHERLICLTRKRSPVQTQYRPPHREASRTWSNRSEGPLASPAQAAPGSARYGRHPDGGSTGASVRCAPTAGRTGRRPRRRAPRVGYQVGIDGWVRFDEDFRRDRAASATSAGGLLWSPGRRRHRSGSAIRSRDRTAADGRRDRLVRPRPLRPDRW